MDLSMAARPAASGAALLGVEYFMGASSSTSKGMAKRFAGQFVSSVFGGYAGDYLRSKAGAPASMGSGILSAGNLGEVAGNAVATGAIYSVGTQCLEKYMSMHIDGNSTMKAFFMSVGAEMIASLGMEGYKTWMNPSDVPVINHSTSAPSYRREGGTMQPQYRSVNY